MANQARLLGALELNWIKSVGGGTGIVVFGALFDKVIDTEHVKAAIEELLDRHVLLGALVVENSKGKLCLETVINPSPSLIIHEKPWPSPDLDGHTGIMFFPHDSHDKQGSLALNRVISNELNTNFLNADGKTIPPLHVFQVHVYAGPGGRHQTVIVLKLHSGIFDRYSSAIVVQEFLGHLKKAVGGGMNSQTSQVRGDCDVLPCIEDLMPKRLLSKGMFQKGIDAVAYAVSSKRCSLLPFNPSFTSSNKPTFKSEFLTLSLGKQGTASLYAACKQEKASHAATLAAAFLKAAAGVRELKEKKLDEFACAFGMNCRALLEPRVGEGVLGLYSLGFPVFQKVKEGVGFWELARHLDASLDADLRKAKQFSEYAVRDMLFSQVLKHPNMIPNSSLRTTLFELFGGDPLDIQQEGFHELGLVGALGPFSSMHFVGPCFAIAETLLEGPELLVSLVYSSPVYCQSQIYQILRSMIDLLYQSCNNF